MNRFTLKNNNYNRKTKMCYLANDDITEGRIPGSRDNNNGEVTIIFIFVSEQTAVANKGSSAVTRSASFSDNVRDGRHTARLGEGKRHHWPR